MSEKTMPVLIRKVDRDTWLKFRALCLEQNISATQKVKNLIDREVKKKS